MKKEQFFCSVISMNRPISTGPTIMRRMVLIDGLIIQRVFHCNYRYDGPVLFYWKISEWLIPSGRYITMKSKSRVIHGPHRIRARLQVGDPTAIRCWIGLIGFTTTEIMCRYFPPRWSGRRETHQISLSKEGGLPTTVPWSSNISGRTRI